MPISRLPCGIVGDFGEQALRLLRSSRPDDSRAGTWITTRTAVSGRRQVAQRLNQDFLDPKPWEAPLSIVFASAMSMGSRTT